MTYNCSTWLSVLNEQQKPESVLLKNKKIKLTVKVSIFQVPSGLRVNFISKQMSTLKTLAHWRKHIFNEVWFVSVYVKYLDKINLVKLDYGGLVLHFTSYLKKWHLIQKCFKSNHLAMLAFVSDTFCTQCETYCGPQNHAKHGANMHPFVCCFYMGQDVV